MIGFKFVEDFPLTMIEQCAWIILTNSEEKDLCKLVHSNDVFTAFTI